MRRKMAKEAIDLYEEQCGKEQHEKDHSEKERYENGRFENQQMTYCIRELPKQDVIGIECEACVWDTDGSIGKLWCEFLSRLQEIQAGIEPMTMYGICESDTCQSEHFIYMAAVGVDHIERVPSGYTLRTIRTQRFFRASVPEEISTPDAYTGALSYAKSLAYEIEDYDQLEVYEEMLRDPESHRFKLCIPIK